jgi:endonuclease YncB( thermonuclease family)
MLDTAAMSYLTRQAARAILGIVAAAAIPWGNPTIKARTPDAHVAGIPISGPVRVVDGDTLVVGGRRVRMEGIDAPEVAQTCVSSSGAPWPCGQRALEELVRLIGRQTVTCDDRGSDKYGRTLGICFAGGIDLNGEMVRRGFAWAFVRYSRTYVAVEAQARASRVGIWSGNAQPAWEYRARQWQTAESRHPAPTGCVIKGNVTRNERIYHMPWSPWYDKINMDLVRGKRWFCTEAEATAAGWRPANVH